MKIYPVKPYFPLEDIARMKEDTMNILSSGMITTYKYTKAFEDEYAKRCGTNYAIAVSSGTASLELVLQTSLKEGNKVLVPTNTFTATVSAIIRAGAIPILADINPETLNLEIDSDLFTSVDAVLSVHIGGIVCPNINEIVNLCNEYKLTHIEDASHAHGSNLYGKFAGSFGIAGCFSLYATKIITTGEGGIITTNDEIMARKLKMLRDQGKTPTNPDEITQLGYSYRFPEISAALGLTQLGRLSEIIKKRTDTAIFYNKELDKISGIRPQQTPKGMVTGYYKHVSFLDDDIDRDIVKRKLKARGVYCGGEIYSIPIHLQPVYKKLLGTRRGDFPNAEHSCDRMLCLPINAWMNREEQEYVIMNVREVMEEI